MSSKDAPTHDDQDAASAVTVSVHKSTMPGLLSPYSDVGLDGEFLWPIAPASLALLYRASPEHARAIHVKSETAFGGGLVGDTDALDELFETGTAETFVLLGLDLETYGNAFLQRIWSLDHQRIIGLRRLPAISMSRYRNGYMQQIFKSDGTVKRVTFTADEIVHLRDPCPMGGRYSLPTWIAAEGMMSLAHAATQYNAKFFKNNAMPEYAVIFKGGKLSAKEKTAITDFFRADFQGLDNAHRTLVITAPDDGSIEFKKLSADVKDGDFLKLIDAARDRVPVAHGTPPRVLGIMSAGQLGGGGEAAGQLFIFEHTTLRPKRRRMLDQLRPTLKLLGLKPGNDEKAPGDGEVLFRALDLTPPKDDAETMPGLVEAGIVSVPEARQLLPMVQALVGRSEGTGEPIERSAPTTQIEALAALLATF